MLKGITEKGEMKNVRVSENGELITKNVANQEGETTEKVETTLNASIITISPTSQIVQVNKKVSEISVANYSETSDITMSIGSNVYQIGANLAVDLPINSTVDSISFVSVEANTKAQIIIKGVE